MPLLSCHSTASLALLCVLYGMVLLLNRYWSCFADGS
jgi:hypothetical protein